MQSGRYILIIFMLTVLLAGGLVACGDEPETASSVRPTATLLPAPTEPAPTDTPPPTPTDEPPTPSEAETSAAPAGNMASFRDNLATADQLTLTLNGLTSPPEDRAYQGWLISDDGAATDIGLLSLNDDGSITLEWNSPGSENLLSRYSGLQVTLEPAAGSEAPTGPVIMAGSLAEDMLINARRLFVKNDGDPATPRDTAFALGLMAQTDVAVQHVQNAINAAAIGALAEMRAHLEHVVNIVEGADGPRFGDHDGNGNAQNPGDGFGVLGYAGQMATLFAGQPAVVEAASDVQTQSAALEDMIFEILQLEDMAVASAQLEELKSLADQLKTDSVISLYQAAQTGAGFALTAGE